MMEWLIDWDVKISDGRIEYFDPTLSYEATGYRPIDDINGLDFDPRWFTKEAADIKERTGKYCPYRFGSKPFRDYWTEQGWRCREGHTINGYTLTGDNYYFVNFYCLHFIYPSLLVFHVKHYSKNHFIIFFVALIIIFKPTFISVLIIEITPFSCKLFHVNLPKYAFDFHYQQHRMN